jgi:hypothetical protein
MNIALTVAALIVASPPANVGAYHPVTVVEDDQEIRRAVGTKVDGTFILGAREAEAPREVLARYLDKELRYEKSTARVRTLRRVLASRFGYFWHCGGYTRPGGRYSFCTMVQGGIPGSNLRTKRFPEIFDGGTYVCRCHYSFRLDAIFWLECNGET